MSAKATQSDERNDLAETKGFCACTVPEPAEPELLGEFPTNCERCGGEL